MLFAAHSPARSPPPSLLPLQIRVEAGEADAEYDGGDDAEAEGEGEEAEAASSKTVAQALEELEGRLQVGFVCFAWSISWFNRLVLGPSAGCAAPGPQTAPYKPHLTSARFRAPAPTLPQKLQLELDAKAKYARAAGAQGEARWAGQMGTAAAGSARR